MPSLSVQPNGTEVSMPITTASLPELITRRACSGVRDDPVPAAAGAAVLRVDVVLEQVHVLGLQPDRVHVVAGVALERVELAELVVLDEQVDQDPLAGPPGALHPLVVGALVGQRVRRRPVLERRPADRVVGGLAGEEGLHRRALAAGDLVVGAVAQGHGHAVRRPGAAAVHVAAEELEGHPVGVRVDEAAHLLDLGGAGERSCRRRWCRSRGSRCSRCAAAAGAACPVLVSVARLRGRR